MAILYGAPLSPFVRKVAVFLEEKGLSYEWKMVKPHADDADFKAISVLGKIPAYRDEVVGLCDSSVICAYLEKAHPALALYPQISADYAKALWFEEYFDSVMITPMIRIYAEGYAKEKFFGKTPDAEKRAKAEAELADMLSYLESQCMAGEWLVGGQFSIADISIACGFANLTLAGYVLDAGAYPALAAHVAHATARPSFIKIAKAMDEFVYSL